MKLQRPDMLALQKIYSYINDHPSETTTIKRLTLIAGMSEPKLTKGFKLYYGETLYHYQLKILMNHAKTQLESGLPIKKVAHTHGYSSPTGFTYAFHKIHNYLPSKVQQLKAPL